LSISQFSQDKLKIAPANQVNPNSLDQFYKAIYPERFDFLQSSWQWLNRTNEFPQLPLVATYENQVIAHAGFMPIKIAFNGSYHTGAWFIDLAVLPEFRRYRIGSQITQAWMEQFDFQMAIYCNEKSIVLFKKIGWIQSFKSFMQVIPIIPFNYPGFKKRLPHWLCNVGNLISTPLLKIWFQQKAFSSNSYSIVDIDGGRLADFSKKCLLRTPSKDCVSIVRDLDFLTWRVLSSPYKNHFKLLKTEFFECLFFISPMHDQSIDIMCVSDPTNSAMISKSIATIATLNKGFKKDYIRFFTSNNSISDKVKKSFFSINSHPLFAIRSQSNFEQSGNNNLDWEIELIDSDFQWIKL